ncbi:MAG: hypothetical protein N2316_07020 [Spirochaetes bacterium]|nr:hypothetical protein [Spirochaetota bacterium]
MKKKYILLFSISSLAFVINPFIGFPSDESSRCVYGNCQDGEGEYQYADGSVYRGEFVAGKRHGKGVMQYPDGSQFSGLWECDKKNGVGISYFADGSEFQGNFVNDEPHGVGMYISADGMCKRAIFKNGTLISSQKVEFEKTDGPYRYGTVIALNGNYMGWYERHPLRGVVPQKRGRIRWEDGARYVGQWKDGKMHGRGSMQWADGSTYEGEWYEGKRCGFGIYVWRSGVKYMGGWKENRKHGQGIAVYPDGRILKGMFYEDQFLGSAK